jgi:ferredoxin
LGHENKGACGGVAACSTCHVIMEKATYDRLTAADDHELDILDQIPLVTETYVIAQFFLSLSFIIKMKLFVTDRDWPVK